MHSELDQRQQLFIDAYSQLKQAAYCQHPLMLVFDCERVLEQVSAELHNYSGPCEPEPFLHWSEAIVRDLAERTRIVETTLKEHRRTIYAAIRRALYGLPEDRSVEDADVFAEVAAYVYANAYEFAKPGTSGAKLSTRLTALVKRHCRNYHTSYRNRRLRLVQEHIEGGGYLQVEHFSEAELASMAEDAMEAEAA